MRFGIYLLFCVLFVGPQARAAQPDQATTAAYATCRTLLLSDTPYATEQSYRLTDDVKYETDANGYFKSLSAEGTWPDLDYHSEMRSAWRPSWHLYRIMLLCRAYNQNYDAAWRKGIHQALAYWIKNDYQCSNWWQNQINVPYAYSSIMLMLGKEATPAELAYLTQTLGPRVAQKNPTGQNKIWQHDIEARIALVNQDAAAFAPAMQQMQLVIQISTGEGIQPDYSFHQHGAMLQFGNYGIHFVNSLLFWMKVTSGTPYAFSPEKQKILFDYCAQGLKYTIYKGAMDKTAIARQLRENADTKRGKNLYDDFKLITSASKTDPCRYALSGFEQPRCPTLPENKSFWRSGYMLQTNSNTFAISVKTHGPFVKKVESINSENLFGAFLNDGVSLIQRSGKEYHNIEPLWNWAMLPGITADTTSNPASEQAFKSDNTADFVGQVSNGASGISVMMYNRLGTKARKSYFLVEGQLIALGAGIEAPTNTHLITTVNQCFYNARSPLQKGKLEKGASWVWHDSVAYIFPDEKQRFHTNISARKGNWQTVDEASGNSPAAGSVFTVYVDHRAQNSYAYQVAPGVSVADISRRSALLNYKILLNTAQLQAIQTPSGVMAVFYEPTTLGAAKDKISVDKPCLLIRQTKGDPHVWVADPTRKLQSVTLVINNKKVVANLPQGDKAGSTVSVF
ncbi:polysaccharide lyase family 8 super-sandwich domain-containing protein [Hymenobacter cavernae]|nr:polysaccharide lyase family 8 super-sandwich domain-containing protein [Hymenobacter cavernae]